ncbi:MAG: CDP-alcohol phosphatidyltransferase family protein [Pirellulales bacterium]|jgi:CDP-diacylglycerol--glycerol-3-phosphate 3-phosphatidyltransferase|nr:CDP-alcohol phosphatidyltransferase family protein [Pirellulales bacterium]
MATDTQQIFNVPNQITMLRLVLSIVVFVLVPLELYIPALIIFAVAAGTDWVDGYYARKYDQVTQLGRILDPFCDKIIICGSYILLSVQMRDIQAESLGLSVQIAGWMAVVVVGRELLVTALRGFIEQHGGDFSAKFSGKLKMVFQCAAVIGSLAVLSNPTESSDGLRVTTLILIWLSVVSTIYTGIIYIQAAIKTIGEFKSADDAPAANE